MADVATAKDVGKKADAGANTPVDPKAAKGGAPEAGPSDPQRQKEEDRHWRGRFCCGGGRLADLVAPATQTSFAEASVPRGSP
jgi:hypothetical protein